MGNLRLRQSVYQVVHQPPMNQLAGQSIHQLRDAQSEHIQLSVIKFQVLCQAHEHA